MSNPELTNYCKSNEQLVIEQQVQEICRLKQELEIEKKNNPFYKELVGDYEEALGPNPRYENGCFIQRTRELRQHNLQLVAELTELKAKMQKYAGKPCGCPGHWRGHAGCWVAFALDKPINTSLI